MGVLGGTFGWFTVVPVTGLMESNVFFGCYLDGFGTKCLINVVFS